MALYNEQVFTLYDQLKAQSSDIVLYDDFILMWQTLTLEVEHIPHAEGRL